MIIMIIRIIIVIVTLSSLYGVEDWGLCGLSLPHLLQSLWFWGVCVACQVLSQSCDTWTKILTCGQTAPPVSLRAPQLLSALCLNSTSAETAAEICLVKTSWESLWHLAKTEGILWYVDGKPSLVVEYLGWGYTAACQVHKPSFGQDLMFSERQVVSPALVAVPQAWRRLNQTGGQPEWGLMRLKPHQRLAYLSSLQSTCATLSVWWELKLPQNSPSSCNYSNSCFVIT